jgi:hypothetical protein
MEELNPNEKKSYMSALDFGLKDGFIEILEDRKISSIL